MTFVPPECDFLRAALPRWVLLDDLPLLLLSAVAQPLAALPPYGCGVPFTGGERHAGWHYLRHKFIGARPPSLSFRGAKRRGNLAVHGWIIGKPRRKRNCLPEIATSAYGLLAMTSRGASTVLTAAGTDRGCFHEIAPQGHFLALRAQGATSLRSSQ